MRLRLAVYSLMAALAIGLAILHLAPAWMDTTSRRVARYDPSQAGSQTVEWTEYHPPQPAADEELSDDQLADKNPPFIPDRVDRRREGDWIVNASAAVLKLDPPMLRPDQDADLLVLRRSYAEAIAAAPTWIPVLPSINLIDGKARQFDDGMLAAIELARFKGRGDREPGDVALVERLHERVGPQSVAAPYLAAGLKVAGVEVETSRPDQLADRLRRFEASPMHSKPFGFYTWTEDLTRAFRFRRYFQQPLPGDQPTLIVALAETVGADSGLLEDYRKSVAFQARLTNPPDALSLADVHAMGGAVDRSRPVAVFPYSRSRETELFRRLFPRGLPPEADLMRELIRAIRSGKVDLTPGPDSGWYDYQVHALETVLMPEKGGERAKLLLTRAYKKRMLEAFQALMTRRRETFAGGLATAEAKSAVPLPLEKIEPRLRVEPCPTYFLRMARSYDFVSNLLAATVGEEGLASLRGRKEGGERPWSLLQELRWMREFFYGLHLLSAEDIGMAPDLRPDEPVDRSACESRASEWLASYRKDPDLAIDTRVSVPLYFDALNDRTRLWATLGVRLAKLDVSYARPPKVRPAQGNHEWQDVTPRQLEGTHYLIAVDEFAEVDIPGLHPLTRKEFRAVCDVYKSKPVILRALSGASR